MLKFIIIIIINYYYYYYKLLLLLLLIDLTKPDTFRDLSKPIGALNEERLAFFKV